MPHRRSIARRLLAAAVIIAVLLALAAASSLLGLRRGAGLAADIGSQQAAEVAAAAHRLAQVDQVLAAGALLVSRSFGRDGPRAEEGDRLLRRSDAALGPGAPADLKPLLRDFTRTCLSLVEQALAVRDTLAQIERFHRQALDRLSAMEETLTDAATGGTAEPGTLLALCRCRSALRQLKIEYVHYGLIQTTRELVHPDNPNPLPDLFVELRDALQTLSEGNPALTAEARALHDASFQYEDNLEALYVRLSQQAHPLMLALPEHEQALRRWREDLSKQIAATPASARQEILQELTDAW